MTVEQDFAVQYDRSRALFPILPTGWKIDPGDPPGGFDGFFAGLIANVLHFLFAAGYTPAPPVTSVHRLIHEVGHALFAILHSFGLTESYLQQRFWAWRFHGSAAAPPSWQDAKSSAWTNGNLGAWSHTPDEMWAEAFVAAVMGSVELERTANYGVPLDAAKARAFFRDLMNEAAPPVYVYPGSHLVAKAQDETLFFYLRDADQKVLVLDDTGALAGMTTKFWK